MRKTGPRTITQSRAEPQMSSQVIEYTVPQKVAEELYHVSHGMVHNFTDKTVSKNSCQEAVPIIINQLAAPQTSAEELRPQNLQLSKSSKVVSN